MRIITRTEWKAITPLYRYYQHIPNKVIFHHYGYPLDEPNIAISPFYDGHASIRALQKEDIYLHGFIDIKFHFIITPDGSIYEGRPTDCMGKHTKDYDKGSIAILVYGNYNIEEVSVSVRKAIVWLLLHLKKKHITLDLPNEIYGHCCKKETDCPGRNLYEYLKKLKNRS